MGRHCGSGWREEGLAEGVLEEVARQWKRSGGAVIVDGDGDGEGTTRLRGILKTLEGCMKGGRIALRRDVGLSRQSSGIGSDLGVGSDVGSGASTVAAHRRPPLDTANSFGLSRLNVQDGHDDDDDDDGDEALTDPREWMTVLSAFEQPKLVYNVIQKHFEKRVLRKTSTSVLTGVQVPYKANPPPPGLAQNRALPPAVPFGISAHSTQ